MYVLSLRAHVSSTNHEPNQHRPGLAHELISKRCSLPGAQNSNSLLARHEDDFFTNLQTLAAPSAPPRAPKAAAPTGSRAAATSSSPSASGWPTRPPNTASRPPPTSPPPTSSTPLRHCVSPGTQHGRASRCLSRRCASGTWRRQPTSGCAHTWTSAGTHRCQGLYHLAASDGRRAGGDGAAMFPVLLGCVRRGRSGESAYG